MRYFYIFLASLFLVGCEANRFVVNDIDEREANEIIVVLKSKGIEAQKIKAESSGAAGGTGPTNMWSITVDDKEEVHAMAVLNQVGLPRRKGTNLLELFAKQGLMSSDKEEHIRFQAGLASQLKNTIRKIDGVLDAEVEISFPVEQAGAGLPGAPGSEKKKITAAVYIKHLGIFDDPNNQLETKIKRLLAGAVQGLDFDSVAVISDRSRFADIMPVGDPETLAYSDRSKEYISVWSIVMTKSSLAKFRFIFFTLIILLLLLLGSLGFVAWKNYPDLLSRLKLGKKKPKSENLPPPPES